MRLGVQELGVVDATAPPLYLFNERVAHYNSKFLHACDFAFRHQLSCASRDEEDCVGQTMQSCAWILHMPVLLNSRSHHLCFGLTSSASECNTIWIVGDGAKPNRDDFALAHCLN